MLECQPRQTAYNDENEKRRREKAFHLKEIPLNSFHNYIVNNFIESFKYSQSREQTQKNAILAYSSK